ATRRAGPQPPGGTDDASDATLPLVAPGPRDGMAREAPPESTTPAVAKALTCPQCLSAVAKGDVFCAVCGSRI
ncbi:MAG: hypothetical protein M3O01_03245, partial [Pseudomonadota bacterium]|nr:hypothetical protein [Pseudomonadota bacterium]